METFAAGFLLVWPWIAWLLGITVAVCAGLFMFGLLGIAVLWLVCSVLD